MAQNLFIIFHEYIDILPLKKKNIGVLNPCKLMNN